MLLALAAALAMNAPAAAQPCVSPHSTVQQERWRKGFFPQYPGATGVDVDPGDATYFEAKDSMRAVYAWFTCNFSLHSIAQGSRPKGSWMSFAIGSGTNELDVHLATPGLMGNETTIEFRTPNLR